jgi:hypothetical protein
MKKLGVILLGGIGVLVSIGGFSQSLEETALLFSRTTMGGSARMQGMGGTQVSLGGDFSSAGSNPAGLGMYNRSEITISPALTFVNNQSGYFGDTTNAFKTKVAIPALSFVFHRRKDDDRVFRGTFGITLNKLNDFNSKTQYEGVNPNNSLADYLAINSDGLHPDEFSEDGDYFNTLNRLAFNNYVIDTIWNDNTNEYNYLSAIGINYFDENDVPEMVQRETIVTSGSQYQGSFSYGGNITDKFFFGVGLHIRTVKYQSKKTYTESDFYFVEAPGYDPINQLTLIENLEINGAGYSATLGVIVRPIDFLQIGISYNTPTTYYLTDTYSASMATDWNDFNYYGDNSLILDKWDDATQEIVSEYTLKTPGRFAFGLTGFLGKAGLISAEVAAVNFKNASYDSSIGGLDYSYENDGISSLYKTGWNFRVGGEFRLKILRFRAGLGHMTDPYKNKQDDVSKAVTNLSLGLGLRKKHFFVDAALLFNTNNSSYRPYSLPDNFSPTPVVSLKNQTASLLFTVGFPF